jgi:hypothetical protein
MRLEQQITVLNFNNASANSTVKGSLNNQGLNQWSNHNSQISGNSSRVSQPQRGRGNCGHGRGRGPSPSFPSGRTSRLICQVCSWVGRTAIAC